MSGEKSDTFDIVLHCLLVMPDYVPVEKRFDILVLTLTLLINLVEHCEHNRTVLLKSPIPLTNDDLFAPGSTASENRKTAGEALVQMFLENEENAKREESKTGNFHLFPFCVFLKEFFRFFRHFVFGRIFSIFLWIFFCLFFSFISKVFANFFVIFFSLRNMF